MWLYLIIFAIPLIVYLHGKAENRDTGFLSLYFLLLALFVGLSDMFGGYDRYIYGEVFDGIADGITNQDSGLVVYHMNHFEIGYSTLSYLIASITENRYIYIFIVTILIYLFIFMSFKENMMNYPLACILFLGLVFYFTFTYLRQVLAFSVAWYGIKFLIERKTWKFFLVAAVVALLHKAGILFAILYFIPIKKWDPRSVLIFLCICAAIGFAGFTGSLYDAYLEVTDTIEKTPYNTQGGSRIAYLFEVAFFAFIILHYYRKIEPTRKNLIFLNMSWMFCGMLLLFIKSSDGGRIAWFFVLGIIYTVTLIATVGDVHKKIKNGIGTVLIVTMLFLFIRVYISWQHYNNLYPYKTFLTNGHRAPDYSWSNYEYDHGYDENKFYRPAFRFQKK